MTWQTQPQLLLKIKKSELLFTNSNKNPLTFHQSNTQGSVLDGRDIITVQVKDAMFKFFITASVETRAKRRFKEYKKLKKRISFKDVLKSLKNRDKSDRQRRYGPLKKTKDSILINTTKLSRKLCFEKIKAIMDRKLNS